MHKTMTHNNIVKVKFLQEYNQNNYDSNSNSLKKNETYPKKISNNNKMKSPQTEDIISTQVTPMQLKSVLTLAMLKQKLCQMGSEIHTSKDKNQNNCNEKQTSINFEMYPFLRSINSNTKTANA